MARPPQVSTIAAGRPFLDTLAAGLLHRAGDAPEALADTLVLLPTRRACRALVEAFLRVGDGRPLILPDIRPLGDVEEEALALSFGAGAADLDLPPVMPEPRRRLLLARLVAGWKGRQEPVTPDQAVRLASELAHLLDEVQTERLDFADLSALVPTEYAAHWQETIEFLKIVTENWPAILADEGCLDPAERRNRLLEAQAARWRDLPPDTPVLAAGSTGSIPATADLLDVVARLPAGEVVLPGLDPMLDSESLIEARGDPAHPQFGMLRLLKRLGIDAAAVAEWDGGPESPAMACATERVRLAAETLRPAESSIRTSQRASSAATRRAS